MTTTEKLRDCKECGASFTARRSDARYCSPRCNVAAWRRRPTADMISVTATETQRDGQGRPVMAIEIAMEPEAERRLRQAAAKRGESPDALIDRALQEMLAQAAQDVRRRNRR